VALKWRDSEEEHRRLELGTSAEESETDLGNERKRCSGGRGWSSPFYRSQGRRGGDYWRDNDQR
jgi:hypothetical protein